MPLCRPLLPESPFRRGVSSGQLPWQAKLPFSGMLPRYHYRQPGLILCLEFPSLRYAWWVIRGVLHSDGPMTAFLRHRTLPRSMPQSMDGVPQRNVAILWLRHDLRVQDNVSLLQACSTAPHRLIPAFFLDPKLLQARTDVPELTSLPTMGPTRLRYLLFFYRTSDTHITDVLYHH